MLLLDDKSSLDMFLKKAQNNLKYSVPSIDSLFKNIILKIVAFSRIFGFQMKRNGRYENYYICIEIIEFPIHK